MTMGKKLTKEEFDNRLKNNRLVISLIGMSNIGKSRWSKKLIEIGFARVHCDDMIGQKLVAYLDPQLGTEGMAKWMGHPYEKRSAKTQKQYLEAEKKTMLEVIESLENASQNSVVDTTGSFIHLDEPTCRKFCEKTLIVYIKADAATRKKIFNRYMENPKPVIWQEIFKPRKNEKNEDALKRCYVNLLNHRAKLYEKYADVTINKTLIKDDKVDVHGFLELIKARL
jgi:shikimate kinase